ncbi:hypothetical protein FHS95_001567 [Sphingomonas naasensis]|uniref:Uncharacterized protein n=1 Tax=Sphingomonas naasensis TaxID=1344951 RepID=A0A4S1WAZ8_9SPHN|nr:hypothetical protein [Sphingomonas naasensis]NIJ19898.1 hypothetical protein [Sphingomonas naasensis]TGX39979.1 hypothetical protein E5A74_15470 [Sphingomonas naasensis]
MTEAQLQFLQLAPGIIAFAENTAAHQMASMLHCSTVFPKGSPDVLADRALHCAAPQGRLKQSLIAEDKEGER